jgi:hypothetical protein
LFNSFPIHSEAWVTAVFRQVIVSNSFYWYRLKKTNYFKISNCNISNKQRQNLIKLAPYLEHILLYKAKVIESFFSVFIAVFW